MSAAPDGTQGATLAAVLDASRVSAWAEMHEKYDGMFSDISCAQDEIADLRTMIEHAVSELQGCRTELDEIVRVTQNDALRAVVSRLDALLGDQERRKEERVAQLLVFTLFCRDANDQHATTFVTSLEATSVDEAKDLAAEECADAWAQEIDTIKVIGVARGDVSLVEWVDDD